MISREIIQKILEAGAQAPSGSNSQPWRFEVSENIISVHVLPEKDHPILNFKNRGTLLAGGALIENVVIGAEHYGIEAKPDLFPDAKNMNLLAKITLHDGNAKDDVGLWNAIWERSTNRKPYQDKELSAVIKAQFTGIPAEIGQGEIALKMTSDRSQINVLAKAASANEIVMLENKELHKLFFQEIVWTAKEETEKKSGLYLKTMELKPPQAMALKLFKNWGAMNFFNKLGAARGIAKGNAKGYSASAAYGAVICDNNDRAFVGLGRVIERAWLRATALGLSFHLQTGVNFLWEGLVLGKLDIFSKDHERIIKEEYQKMLDIFQEDQRLIPAIFRIGYDGEPSARSSKKSPEIVFL